MATCANGGRGLPEKEAQPRVAALQSGVDPPHSIEKFRAQPAAPLQRKNMPG